METYTTSTNKDRILKIKKRIKPRINCLVFQISSSYIPVCTVLRLNAINEFITDLSTHLLLFYTFVRISIIAFISYLNIWHQCIYTETNNKRWIMSLCDTIKNEIYRVVKQYDNFIYCGAIFWVEYMSAIKKDRNILQISVWPTYKTKFGVTTTYWVLASATYN